MLLPSDADARLTLAVVLGAFGGVGGLDSLQRAILEGVARGLYRIDPDELHPASPDELRRAPLGVRRQAAYLMVVLEFVEHPLRSEVADAVAAYTRLAGVPVALLDDARELARDHFAVVYFDLQRQGWYREETIRESLRGRWLELLRSKLSYLGIGEDPVIAARWRALRDCAPDTWGRGVADFYERHGFPFPGERHGIYELGARHDWVHVLADYETTPEGEIDVFSFIAASMADERGLVLLAFTLGLFQNGSIHRVAGKRLDNVRTDTLFDDGAVARFVDALTRGRACTVDVMGTLDLFDHKDEPLVEVRDRFGVRAKQP